MQTRRNETVSRLIPRRAVAALGCALVLFALMPSTTLAHPDLDTAIERAQEADFDNALVAFNAALASGTLTRDELVNLLGERALVLHALGKSDALEYDLAYLAMLDPGHELGRSAPPAVIESFESAVRAQGAALSIDASCAPSSTGTRIEMVVNGLRDASFGQPTLHTRGDGQSWVQKQADHADIAGDDPVEYFAEVRGIGGIVLVSAGSVDSPLSCVGTGSEPRMVASGPVQRDDPKSHKKLWWWIGGAAAVAVVGVAAAVLVVSKSNGRSDDTVVSKPMVSF